MGSPLIADGGGVDAESRIRYEGGQGSPLGQHDDQREESFSGGNFNDGDDDVDEINNPCPTNGRRSPFWNVREEHESYSADREMAEDLASGRPGEGQHQNLEGTHEHGRGDERGAGGSDYDDHEAGGNWAALQETYNDPPSISGATQSDPAGLGAGAGSGGGSKRSFSRHLSPHRDDDNDDNDDDDRETHRVPRGVMGGATAQETEDHTIVNSGGGGSGGGGSGGGDGEIQRLSSSDQEAGRFKQHHHHHQHQPQPKRPGFLSGSRRSFRSGFHKTCNNDDDEAKDNASNRGGGGGEEESAGSPSPFDGGGGEGGGEQSGASAFSENDADDASNGNADPWASPKASEGKTNTREEVEGENEGDPEEGGAEGQAQKRQRQQRRKHSELLVGNSFSVIARCYAAANHAIRGVEADQRTMLEAETEIREDLVTFGVRVKEATHLMQMQLAAAFTEDGLGTTVR